MLHIAVKNLFATLPFWMYGAAPRKVLEAGHTRAKACAAGVFVFALAGNAVAPS